MTVAVARFRTLVLSALVLLMLVSLTTLLVSYALQYFFLFDDFALIELPIHNGRFPYRHLCSGECLCDTRWMPA